MPLSASSWCPRRDLNPHGLPHTALNRARLPVPPPGRRSNYTGPLAGSQPRRALFGGATAPAFQLTPLSAGMHTGATGCIAWKNRPVCRWGRVVAMSDSLHGKVALVTGGARGIGAGIARALSAGGAAVVINYVQAHREAEALASELNRPDRPAFAVRADVSRRDQVAAMVEEV